MAGKGNTLSAGVLKLIFQAAPGWRSSCGSG